MRGGTLAPMALALALVLLTGCGGGSSKEKAAPATTTTSAPVACPPGSAVPPGATDTTTANGDFDGDGKGDTLKTYRVASAGTWHVRVDLASGGSSEAELPATATGVKAVGGAALDVGTGEAAFVVVGAGPDGANVGLFALRSCQLERATVAGAPGEFPVGTSANSRSGLACEVPGLVAYKATTTDGRSYQASTVSYLLVGSVLDEVHRAASTLLAGDAQLPAYGTFACGTLKL